MTYDGLEYLKASLDRARLKKKLDLINYITAGKAIFTVEVNAPINGQFRYTYKFLKKNKYVEIYRLHSCDNEKDYRFIGLWNLEDMTLSKFKQDKPSKCIVALITILSTIDRDKLPDTVTFHKSLYCARCGRLLTTPWSIMDGMGPKCKRRI